MSVNRLLRKNNNNCSRSSPYAIKQSTTLKQKRKQPNKEKIEILPIGDDKWSILRFIAKSLLEGIWTSINASFVMIDLTKEICISISPEGKFNS